METKTQSITELLQDYNKEKDCNHWVRRFARCYFDGSYDYSKLGYSCGSDFYKNNMNDFKLTSKIAEESPRDKDIALNDMLKRNVIYYFTHFIALEHDCSYSHAQKCIVKALSKSDLELLTNKLISDYIEIYDID